MLILTLLDHDDAAAYPLAVSLNDNLEGLQEVARIEFASSVDPLETPPEPAWVEEQGENGSWWHWEPSDQNTYSIEAPINTDLI
jgi:hypothetical protein